MILLPSNKNLREVINGDPHSLRVRLLQLPHLCGLLHPEVDLIGVLTNNFELVLTCLIADVEIAQPSTSQHFDPSFFPSQLSIPSLSASYPQDVSDLNQAYISPEQKELFFFPSQPSISSLPTVSPVESNLDQASISPWQRSSLPFLHNQSSPHHQLLIYQLGPTILIIASVLTPWTHLPTLRMTTMP